MLAPDVITAARRALVDERRQLSLDELAALAALSDADLPALAEAAHAVRLAWCGDVVEIEGILSAKTGGCPEDCHFCSQSSRFDSPVKAVPLLSHAEVLAAARETAELGASEFCLVYAVRGPDERLMAHLEEIVPLRAPGDRAQRGGQRRDPRPATRPPAWPRRAPTATTTTWRRPGRTSARS